MIDNLLAKKMRAHQLEGASFLLECLKGKAQIKAKQKKDADDEGDGEGHKMQADDDDEEENDFVASPRSISSMSPKADIPGKEFYGAILADEMGLGKTLQAISVVAAFVKQKSKRGIIVCPSSLIENWRNEIRKWMSVSMVPLMIQTGSKPPPIECIRSFNTNLKSSVMIISYELFRKHIEDINNIESLEIIVCDEAHKLKGNDGTKTNGKFLRCMYVWCLPITPRHTHQSKPSTTPPG